MDYMRFWDKVDIGDAYDCWEWNAYRLPNGYGRFNIAGKVRYAHRVSWMMYNRIDIPEDKELCHICDNPSCVNPKHLWVGTHSENIKDSYDKGRVVFERLEDSDTYDKLTSGKIESIKLCIADRKYDYKNKNSLCVDIGNRYRVSWQTVQCILDNMVWICV
jgi:hypothetical protein